ncbi:S8 family serine peptidase [Massilia sp. BJB1822]|uniref:S8 family serine peptidase n=1 Tax=Massilia sp. BJB1822 TaxID=2744470 RepID=UPI0015941D18|nr:S8 family serine peptidase [Massilia sp. BJB1822]NVD98078.1 S8 family serine peptidase [Massilia sp. BJB1822]
MKKRTTIFPQDNTFLSATILVTAAALAAITPPAQAGKPQHVQQDEDLADSEYAHGRILVEPREGVTEAGFDEAIRPHKGKRRKMGQSNIHMIDLPHGSEKAALAKLRKDPQFKYVELDRRVKLSATANDPYLGSEWHIAKIGVPAAWDVAQGAGVTIAILDSGVYGAHPDLAPRLVAGWNVYGNNADTSDVCGHGTAVAGVAAAAMDNGAGVAGVAGNAKIMPVRVAFKDASGSCYAYYSTMASGVTYAADHGARVVNLSYDSVPASSAVQSAANYLKSKGGLLFVAAGNNNRDEGYAPTTSMISVSATDSADARSSFSSYGSFVSLSAPGSYIYTTNMSGGYSAWNGTSFASPVAAGVAALMMSANPALDGGKIESLLYSTAVDLGTPGRDIYFGNGRVNAAAAVAAARSATGTVAKDSSAPTVAIASPSASSSVTGAVNVTVNAADNVGVARVDLKVNNTVVASDSSAPYAFSWDSKGVANGMASLVAVAYDAAGNVASSTPVAVNVANSTPVVTADTQAPTVKITNPVSGKVSGNVNVKVNASDNSGAAGIALTLYIDGQLKANGSGSSLSYAWKTGGLSAGQHTLQTVATDKAGNRSTSSVQVTK